MRDLMFPGAVWVAAFAAFAFQSGCGAPERSVPKETGTVPVQAVILKTVPFDQVYEASGAVRSRQRAVLASRLQGTVLEVHVKLGDAVRAGQVLAEVDHRELDAEVSRAEAARTAVGEAMTQAAKSLEAVEAEKNLAGITLRRYQELFEKRSVSRQELDQAVAREQVAQANVDAARARLQETEARQKEAVAALEAAQVRREYARVTAPFAGVVVQRHVDAGTVAMPGMPLLTLDESTGFRLEVSLPEAHLAAARLGVPAKVSIPAISLESEGRIVEIEAAAEEGSRTSLVRVSLPAVEGLRSGLFGRALFSLGEANMLTVPALAVLRQGQLVSAFVHEDGRARRRLVTLGRQLDGAFEVLSGLVAGEQVITSSLDSLADGSRVEILP